MTDDETVKTKEAGDESEIAELQANRISCDFSYRDKMALREATEAIPIATYAEDVKARLDGSSKLLEELRDAIRQHKHETTDINEKVQFEKLLDKVKLKAYHAVMQPRMPGEVRSAQQGFEGAEDDFQRRHVKDAETIDSALRGEQHPDEKYPGELAKNYKVENVRRNLGAEQLSKIQTQVSDALERLKNLAPQIKEIAKQKALKPEEKEEVLKGYEDKYGEYEAIRKEMQRIVKEIERGR